MKAGLIADEGAQPLLHAFLADRKLASPGAYLIGVTDRTGLAAVVGFHATTRRDLLVVAAADRASWCRPRILKLIAGYAFQQLGAGRVTAVVAKSNKRARRLAEGLGWKIEGALRRHAEDGGTSLVYGLLRDEWLIGEPAEVQ